MNIHDTNLAGRLADGDRSPFFVEHRRELYPLDRAHTTLPGEVLSGDREPDGTETLEALKAEGYTLN